MSKRFIVLDTETTGLEVEQGHRIIEIGALLLEDRKKTDDHFHVYLNPERLIDEEAQKVHGISNKDLIDKPKFSDIADEFLEFSKSRGNDLTRDYPEYNFKGLKDGDKWCLCASRWVEAYEVGLAPKIILEATHIKTLDFISLQILENYKYS